jgi:hypothetical protein
VKKHGVYFIITLFAALLLLTLIDIKSSEQPAHKKKEGSASEVDANPVKKPVNSLPNDPAQTGITPAKSETPDNSTERRDVTIDCRVVDQEGKGINNATISVSIINGNDFESGWVCQTAFDNDWTTDTNGNCHISFSYPATKVQDHIYIWVKEVPNKDSDSTPLFFPVREYTLSSQREHLDVELKAAEVATLTIEVLPQQSHTCVKATINGFGSVLFGYVTEKEVWFDVHDGKAIYKVPILAKIQLKVKQSGFVDSFIIDAEPLLPYENRTIKVQMEPGPFSLSGICLDENRLPISGVLLYVEHKSYNGDATSNQEGKFTIAGLSDKSGVEVECYKTGFEPKILTNINLSEFLVITLEKCGAGTAKLKGKCIDEDGNGIEGVRIFFTCTYTNPYHLYVPPNAFAQTDTQGEFSISLDKPVEDFLTNRLTSDLLALPPPQYGEVNLRHIDVNKELKIRFKKRRS